MNLEMTFDDKMKPVNEQLDQKLCHRKAKGLHFLSSPWWCPAAMTLAILCVGLSVTLIVQWMQLLQVSDLLKQYQANLTHQEHILEGQILAQQQAANASQKELEDTIDTLTWQLEEKTKQQEELVQQNLNLQNSLQRAANFSVLQVSDLLKQYQANLTHQKHILEGQILAQQQAANASQKELEDTIDTLTWQLEEKTKQQEELVQQNLNLQNSLQRAANFSGPCPQDWLWHKERCYLFSYTQSYWAKSQENCLSLDAQLLQISSIDDLNYILQATSHSTSPFWMGLHRKKKNDPWLWENGPPLRPHLFKIRGIPSQTHPSGTCVYIQNGAIFADHCILTAFSICEKRAKLLLTESI
ncbi:oxidized low-density lipoprotein receptor 1 isoform X1 [Phodopus roborovskii]|uniref:Oxidized low-density lipoprotein receptor 1 n=1 Tax=Phodopus roborovskii TaxID=109678 RepID=A0AAV0ACY2_PHORO|nr:oxidized low-density lipoprotein receptor 1 isoform X1 [Phodopus roborovskii]CAH7424004.1 Olr1 [Phodopus roborovskii]